MLPPVGVPPDLKKTWGDLCRSAVLVPPCCEPLSNWAWCDRFVQAWISLNLSILLWNTLYSTPYEGLTTTAICPSGGHAPLSCSAFRGFALQLHNQGQTLAGRLVPAFPDVLSSSKSISTVGSAICRAVNVLCSLAQV